MRMENCSGCEFLGRKMGIPYCEKYGKPIDQVERDKESEWFSLSL